MPGFLIVGFSMTHWKHHRYTGQDIDPDVKQQLETILANLEERNAADQTSSIVRPLFLLPDAQGRVRIPQSLMREAGLQKDVMLVGMLSKFEIWDQTRFDALTLEDVSDELAASGVTISL